MASLLSLLGVWCFALSQTKHAKTLLGNPLSDKVSKLLQLMGVLVFALAQYWLVQSSQVGLNYVIWLCWLSVWILMTGAVLSFIAHKKTKRRTSQSRTKAKTKTQARSA